ncbi:EcsC family protein [Methylobacterium oryzisoli]|uniref:EcsC family protein n=1 Tax=Methylobacterium oryzisoli TaxID=3385502 RepID=UPI00389290C0
MSEASLQAVVPADARTGTSFLPSDEHEALRLAVITLESPSLVARFSNFAGRPVELIGHVLPRAASKIIARASRAALTSALRLALTTLPNVPAKRGLLIHKALAATSGALGGAVGIVSLPLELPIATALILRAIAEIAQSEGEDLASPDVALACVQVFALGGGQSENDNPAESSYFAVRAALAQSMSEAAHFVAEQGFVGQGAPVLIRLAAEIASRFGVVVSQKLAAQALPLVGALGGAVVNTVFMDHYQDIAHAHFTVRRLERIYGKERIRSAYEQLRLSELDQTS